MLMFERGIRGRITHSVHRWAAANNPYMGSEYDPSRPTKCLQYLDANNLYGWAMSQPLPTGGFHWVEFDVRSAGEAHEGRDLKYIVNELAKCEDCGCLLEVDVVYPRESKWEDCGCLLEVDVAYPRELLDYHNDLPFMRPKMKLNEVEKSVPNLFYKRKYVVHIKALKQAIDHGLVLEKIHRAIEFRQSAWMREYIDFNTKLRTAA